MTGVLFLRAIQALLEISRRAPVEYVNLTRADVSCSTVGPFAACLQSMSHQCLYIEQNVSGGCLLGRQFVVDNDGFANQQGWMTDDQIDYLATAAGTTDTFQGSDKWVLANGEHGSCFIEPQFDPAGGQQFLSNDPMLPDAETESLSGDRRVSSSSTDSNGSDLWPAANVWDAFAPAPHSGTTEAPGRGAYKTRWLCHECGHEFPTSQKLETHAKSVQHKAYVCKACKKGFSRRDTYGRHVVTHRVSAGLHQCEVCKAQNVELLFKRKDHLEQHKRNKHFKPIIRGMLGGMYDLAHFG